MFKRLFQRRYNQWYRHARQLFIFDIVLLLGILTLLGVGLFLFYYGLPVTRHIELTVAPDITITDFKNGGPLPLSISYNNTSDALLQDVTLSLVVSAGYQLHDDSVFSNATKTWEVGSLAPGANGSVTLPGTLLASVDEHSRVVTVLSYRQATRSVREEKTASFVLAPEQIVHPALTITTNPSETIFTEQVISQPVTICNPHESVTIPGGTLHMHIENGEHIDSSASLAQFTPDTCGEITFTYSVDSPGESHQDIWFTTSVNATPVTIAKQKHVFTVQDLKPEAHITPQSTVLEPGETQQLTITLTNPHDVALHNLTLEIPAEGTLTKTATLTPATHPELLVLAPQQRVSLTSPITAAQSPFTHTQADQTSVILRPNISLTPDDQPVIYELAPLHFTVPTQPVLGAVSRYFSPYGDQLGRGPLPPVAGFETKYWVFVTTGTKFGPLKNPTLSITTAPGAAFTGKHSMTSGELDSPNNTTRVWSIDNMNPTETHGVFLEVSVTPSTAAIGTTPVLLQNITLVGIDPRSSTSVTRSHGQLMADLRHDNFADDYATEVLAP